MFQLTVHFPDKSDRKALIEQVSKFLGKAQQGESGEDAPSKYFANWVRDAVAYDFQDYGDYMEMYVSPSRFSPTERYKLPEQTLVVQRAEGKVLDTHAANTVLLLAIRPDEKSPMMNSFNLFIQDRGNDMDKGTIVALPKDASGSSPQLALRDFDGDHVEDVLVSAKAGDGHAAAWILSVKGKQGSLLFDSAKTAALPFTAGGYDALKAVDTDGNGVYDLDASGKADAAGKPGTVHGVLRWQNGSWKEVTK